MVDYCHNNNYFVDINNNLNINLLTLLKKNEKDVYLKVDYIKEDNS